MRIKATSELKPSDNPGYSKYGLLTKREVKMAGYRPSSFFVCLWTEMKSSSINSQKKEQGQYPAILTEKAWSIKALLFGFQGIFSKGTWWVVPSGQDGAWFILPAHGASHIITFLTQTHTHSFIKEYEVKLHYHTCCILSFSSDRP